ncbi:hypothetical protein [Neorhizobium sp. NCHU2750]
MKKIAAHPAALIGYKTSNMGRDFAAVSDRAEVAEGFTAQIGGN